MADIRGRAVVIAAAFVALCATGCTERDTRTGESGGSREMGNASPGDPIKKGDAPAARDMGRYPGDVPGEKSAPPPPGRSPR